MARITAQEARIKTDSVISAEDKYILNAIDNCIKKACDEGQYHIWYNEKLSDIVLTDLKNHGFDIEDLSSNDEGNCFKINW